MELGWNKMYNGHHFLSFRIGRNGPYNTLGATFNPNVWGLFLIPNIDVALWSQQIGAFAGDKEDKRISAGATWIFEFLKH